MSRFKPFSSGRAAGSAVVDAPAKKPAAVPSAVFRRLPSSTPKSAVNPTAVSPTEDAPQRKGRATLVLFGFFALMFTVPIAELATRFAHVYVPVFPAVELLLTVAVLFSGRLGRFWETKLAVPWMILMVLFTVAAMFGEWTKQCVLFMGQYDLRFHVFPFYCCAIVVSTRQVRHCISWLCAGALLLLLLCATAGQMSLDGRFFVLPESSLSNPNDLAFWLMLGVAVLTFWLYTPSLLLRGIWAVATPALMYYILKTGSRANFLTLIAVGAVMFFTSSRGMRLKLLLVMPITVVVAFFTIPSTTMTRLTSIFFDPSEEVYSQVNEYGAVSSQMARTELQRDAIELSSHHPLLGVGAGMFEVAVDEMVRAETGHKSGWQAAHDTYLEITAENGIPAGLIFVLVILMCLRMNYVSYRTCKKNAWQEPAVGASLCLLLMSVAFAIGLAFNNSSYSPQIAMLVGLTAANYLAVQNESRQAPSFAVAVAPLTA